MADSRALEPLFTYILPRLEWPYALLRGRYMKAVARMEWIGVPIDTALWLAFKEYWEPLKAKLIATVDRFYGIYDGDEFRNDRFLARMEQRGIEWPRFPSGQPILETVVFRDMAQLYPELRPLFELRSTTAKLRLVGLTVGKDGRNRCLLSPFSAKTSRNLPSSSKFIFGSARWMRGLIQAPPGHALIYIDWSGQEFAIAAALSGDPVMLADYASGDPHLAFAKRHGLAPQDATAETHPEIREMCKTVNLGTLYGLTEIGLAIRLGILPARARQLLRLHRDTYRRYWSWIEQTVHSAMINGYLTSTFGWHYHIAGDVNPRSLQNWPMQTNAAEMMRIGAIAATEADFEICCPVHDAFLGCTPFEHVTEKVAMLRDIMRRASLLVTGGIEVRTDVKIIPPGERYMDKRARAMWLRAIRLLANVKTKKASIYTSTVSLLQLNE
jgi:hypothetical protein